MAKILQESKGILERKSQVSIKNNSLWIHIFIDMYTMLYIIMTVEKRTEHSFGGNPI